VVSSSRPFAVAFKYPSPGYASGAIARLRLAPGLLPEVPLVSSGTTSPTGSREREL
jgi:hypothetical protein